MPVQLWLDSQWRPVRVIIDYGGASILENISYDAPETIVAPPIGRIRPT